MDLCEGCDKLVFVFFSDIRLEGCYTVLSSGFPMVCVLAPVSSDGGGGHLSKGTQREEFKVLSLSS